MENEQPKGRGGWLGLLVFQLFASPLILAGREAGDISSVERQGVTLPEGFFAVYILTIILCGAPLFLAGHLLATGAKRQDALDALKFMWGGFAAIIAGPALVFAHFVPDVNMGAELGVQLLVASFWGILWTLYIFKSKRVRNTFMPTGGWPKKNTKRLKESALPNVSLEVAQVASSTVGSGSASSAKTVTDTALKFTMFRSTVDEKWYWVLTDGDSARVIARGNQHENRSACLADVARVRLAGPSAAVWDKTANEFV